MGDDELKRAGAEDVAAGLRVDEALPVVDEVRYQVALANEDGSA